MNQNAAWCIYFTVWLDVIKLLHAVYILRPYFSNFIVTSSHFVTFVPVSNINQPGEKTINHSKQQLMSSNQGTHIWKYLIKRLLFFWDNDSMSLYVTVCDEMMIHYFFQTAETIVKHNSSCSALQMVCDPLLKEKVSGIYFVILQLYSKSVLLLKHFLEIYDLVNR